MQFPLCTGTICSLIWAQIGDVDPSNPRPNRKQEFINYERKGRVKENNMILNYLDKLHELHLSKDDIQIACTCMGAGSGVCQSALFILIFVLKTQGQTSKRYHIAYYFFPTIHLAFIPMSMVLAGCLQRIRSDMHNSW